MARIEISEIVLRSAGSAVSTVPGASVQVNIRGAGAATVYAAASGGTTLSNPLTSDSAGRIEGWLEEGSYDLVVSGASITTYTQRIEAISAYAGSLVARVASAEAAYVNVKSPEYGAVGDGVTDDTAAFNAAMADCTVDGTLSGSASRTLHVPGGTYMISSMLTCPPGFSIEGGNPDTTILKAHASFVWGGVNTALMRSFGATYDDVTTSLTRRFFPKGLLFHCNGMANSNGLLCNLQQPGKGALLRVQAAKGYGVAIVDAQQASYDDLQIMDCGVGLRIRSALAVYINTLNIEQSDTAHMIAEALTGSVSTRNNRICNIHMEGLDGNGVNVDIRTGSAWEFENVIVSPTGTQTIFKFELAGDGSVEAIGYEIGNTWMNVSDLAGVTFINDVDRGHVLDAYTHMKKFAPRVIAPPQASAGVSAPAVMFLGKGGRKTLMHASPSGAMLDTSPGSTSTADQITARKVDGTAAFRVDYQGKAQGEAWTNLTLTNGFTAVSGRTPQYAFEPDGVTVRLRGAISAAAADTNTEIMGTLPSGYRPPFLEIRPGGVEDTGGAPYSYGLAVKIATNGEVSCPGLKSALGGTPAAFRQTLDGITFKVA